MARDRTVKIGIGYFTHDTDMMQDIKMKLIKAKHGLVGYAVYIRLLEELYRDKGYYLQLSEDFNILFSNDNNLDLNVYILILNDCILRELFNSGLYKKYNILTSTRIQYNYISATERRREVFFYKEYLLVDVEEKYDGKKVNVNISTLNADICTQKKVKEKKVKEKKVNIYTEIFNQAYKLYPRSQAKLGTFKNWNKLLKEYTEDELFEFTKNYKGYYDSMPEDKKEYAFASNNFYGEKGVWEDFKEPKKWQGKSKKATQCGNYKQREYPDEYYDNLYEKFDDVGEGKNDDVSKNGKET